MKKLLAVALLMFVGLYARASGWSPLADNWEMYYNGRNNTMVWNGPQNQFRFEGGFGRNGSTFTQAVGGGVNIAETGAVALADGRVATLTATRFASGANILKGARAVAAGAGALAGGPLGVAILMMELPSLIDWINSEPSNSKTMRIDPVAGGLQKSDPTVCTVSPCYTYTDGWAVAFSGMPLYTTKNAACTRDMDYYDSVNSMYRADRGSMNTTSNCSYNIVTRSTGGYVASSSRGFVQTSAAVQSAVWLPASFDDLAIPLTNGPVPLALIPDIVRRQDGSIIDPNTNLMQHIPIDVTPVSVTGPNPALPAIPPFSMTTAYPKPADVTSSKTTAGNPYGIAANVATITSVVKGSASLNPGSTSFSGEQPAGYTPVVPNAVNTPTTTTTTSTFNPTTNQTTDTVTTTQDAASQVVSSTTTSTVTNTTNSSTVTNNTTNVTNITNTTTAQPLAPTKTDTGQTPTTDPTKTDCEKYPTHIGCAEFGQAPAPEAIPTLSIPVSITPVMFAAPSGCPAPYMGSIDVLTFHKPWSITFDAMCNLMTTLRLLFLAVGAAAAAWLFMEGLKV